MPCALQPQELESNYGSFVQASRNPWTNSLSVEQLKNMNAAVAADMVRAGLGLGQRDSVNLTAWT